MDRCLMYAIHDNTWSYLYLILSIYIYTPEIAWIWSYNIGLKLPTSVSSMSWMTVLLGWCQVDILGIRWNHAPWLWWQREAACTHAIHPVLGGHLDPSRYNIYSSWPISQKQWNDMSQCVKFSGGGKCTEHHRTYSEISLL